MATRGFLRTYMPEIAWFDSRAPILAVDIQQIDVPKERIREFERDTERYYKLVTVSTQSDVRIWDFCFGRDGQLFTDFIANLEGHNGTVNCCKFSPNGEMLATGDTYGALLVWYHSDEPLPPANLDDYELPPNRENWKRQKRLQIRHESDVTCVAWSPNSQLIASGSNDDSVSVFDIVEGKRLWMLRNFRHFPVGLAWDPRGKFIMSLSTDRRFDIIEATKGKPLRTTYTLEGLKTKFSPNVESHATGQYKLYHDSQLASFSRTLDFSPGGELLFTPTAHIEIGESNVYGTYVYKRTDFDKCRPSAMLPSKKPTFLVRCSPVVYKLRESVKSNYLGLPYRIIYAVMTKDSITLHDSQFSVPIAYTDNLHYDVLTCLTWTPDGTTFTVSSQEGYNTFVTNFAKTIGDPIPLPLASEADVILEQPKSKRATKKDKENQVTPSSTAETLKAITVTDAPSTPVSVRKKQFAASPSDNDSSTSKSTTSTPTSSRTPKNGVSLLDFFVRVSNTKKDEAESGEQTPKKDKKRVTTVILDD